MSEPRSSSRSSSPGRLPPPLDEQPLLLLSPHLDDAALSCAALIARERPIEVVTVFAGEPQPPRRSRWDRVTGFPDSTATMSARRAEDAAAFAGTPHVVRHLDLVAGEYLDGRGPADAGAIGALVAAWLDEHPQGAVAVPAGAGSKPGRLRSRWARATGRHRGPVRHPDHVFVRDAALAASFARSREGVVVLYEELPYAWGGAADAEVRRTSRRHELLATPVSVAVDTRAKAARIAAYRSQTPHMIDRGRRVDDAGDLPSVERYWILDRRG